MFGKDYHVYALYIKSGTFYLINILNVGKSNRSKLNKSAAELFATLKDHNHPDAIQLANDCYQNCIREACAAEGYDIERIRNRSKPAKLVLLKRLNDKVRRETLAGLQRMNAGVLDLVVVDEGENGCQENITNTPTCNILKAIRIVETEMERTHFGWHEEEVYRKFEEMKFTYVYHSKMETYLLSLLSDTTVGDFLIPVYDSVLKFLSHPQGKFMKPVVIDFNFIEVLLPHGTCFDISGKRFVQDLIELKGSPRAFVRYIYDDNVQPNPRYFVQGICYNYLR